MRFKVLCTVVFLHDYFADGKMDGISCVPTANTKAKLAAMGALIKLWRHELYILIKCDEDDRPLKPIDTSFQLQFYWAPADSFFYQYTNLGISPDKRFFYSNGFANDTAGYLYAQAPDFDDQKEYSTGSFVRAPGNETYEALANIAAGSDLTDDMQWINRGNASFATTEQACIVFNETWELPVKPAATAVEVKIYNHSAGIADAALPVFQHRVSYATPVSMHRFVPNRLPAGLYKVDVNGNQHKVYLADDSGWPAYT
nr:hypothetical protein [Chitinophagaceae bacterium]